MADRLLAASQEPFLNDPHVPFGSPKLANWISEIVCPVWHVISNKLPSYALPHKVPILTVWKDTGEGVPPISSNKINVFLSLLRNDLGMWYLRQIINTYEITILLIGIFVLPFHWQSLSLLKLCYIPSLSRMSTIWHAIAWVISSSIITCLATSCLIGNVCRPKTPNALSIHPCLPFTHAFQVHHHRVCAQRCLEFGLNTTQYIKLRN